MGKSVPIDTPWGPDRAMPFRVEFLLTRSELVDLFAYAQRHHTSDKTLPRYTRAEANAVVRETLRSVGESRLWEWEDLCVCVGSVRDWATETVNRLFGKEFKE